MAKVKLIAIAGMPGSGKGTVTDYLAEKFDFPVVHFGSMVYDEVQRRGLDNVKDEKFVREDMRTNEGKEVLAIHGSKKADQLLAGGAKAVVLDGLYSWSELRFLAKKYSDKFVVIAVVTPRKQRYRQALARKDEHRKYASEAQIRDRDINEIENLEKGGPIAFADYYLLNTGTPEELKQNLEHIITELGLS